MVQIFFSLMSSDINDFLLGIITNLVKITFAKLESNTNLMFLFIIEDHINIEGLRFWASVFRFAWNVRCFSGNI